MSTEQETRSGRVAGSDDEDIIRTVQVRGDGSKIMTIPAEIANDLDLSEGETMLVRGGNSNDSFEVAKASSVWE